MQYLRQQNFDMPLTAEIDTTAALNRLAESHDIPEGRGRDAELARRLAVSSAVLSSWRKRGALDYPTVILDCAGRGISLEWLFFNWGPMHLPEAWLRPTPEAEMLSPGELTEKRLWTAEEIVELLNREGKQRKERS